MKFTKFFAAAATVIATCLPSVSSAASFSCITNNTGSCATTVAPLMTYTLVGTQLSIFNNDASPGSFISGISFDYVSGMDVALNAIQMAGVSYKMTGNDEAHIPGSFGWTVDEGAIDNKGSKNVNAIQGGEKIVFTLSNVNLSHIGNSFKFGIHVQSLPQGESEKLIAVTAVPEPETYAMMLAGLGLMGTIARRRKNKNA